MDASSRRGAAASAKLGMGESAVEFNRNQYFLAGMVLLFLGYQFRMVESFTLNERATEFIEARVQKARAAVDEFTPTAYTPPQPIRREVTPPRWLGLAMISIGCVLVLHSLAMPKPS